MKGYSSMPNDPLGRYKGVLSLAQLERARRCALQNAEELVSDAELLVQQPLGPRILPRSDRRRGAR
jgi:hypothetical protein